MQVAVPGRLVAGRELRALTPPACLQVDPSPKRVALGVENREGPLYVSAVPSLQGNVRFMPQWSTLMGAAATAARQRGSAQHGSAAAARLAARLAWTQSPDAFRSRCLYFAQARGRTSPTLWIPWSGSAASTAPCTLP